MLTTAGALIATALTAYIASRQYRQGEKIRREHAEQAEQARLDQARPYVLLTVDAAEVSVHLIDLVLSNVGVGPARDVRITVTPPLARANETTSYPLHKARVFTEPIEMLPPGFQQRIFFDSAADRRAADPRRSATRSISSITMATATIGTKTAS